MFLQGKGIHLQVSPDLRVDLFQFLVVRDDILQALRSFEGFPVSSIRGRRSLFPVLSPLASLPFSLFESVPFSSSSITRQENAVC
jgi:hypothetical protein